MTNCLQKHRLLCIMLFVTRALAFQNEYFCCGTARTSSKCSKICFRFARTMNFTEREFRTLSLEYKYFDSERFRVSIFRFIWLSLVGRKSLLKINQKTLDHQYYDAGDEWLISRVYFTIFENVLIRID